MGQLRLNYLRLGSSHEGVWRIGGRFLNLVGGGFFEGFTEGVWWLEELLEETD
jgi:hypothetical protein